MRSLTAVYCWLNCASWIVLLSSEMGLASLMFGFSRQRNDDPLERLRGHPDHAGVLIDDDPFQRGIGFEDPIGELGSCDAVVNAVRHAAAILDDPETVFAVRTLLIHGAPLVEWLVGNGVRRA